MNTTEVIEREEQRQGSLVVVPKLAESVRQTGHATNVCSDGQVSDSGYARAYCSYRRLSSAANLSETIGRRLGRASCLGVSA